MFRVTLCFAVLLAFCFRSQCSAQKFVANYDEAKIPKYSLPDPLVMESGKPVTSATRWNETRRPEILELFQKHVYGRAPEPCPIRYKVISSNADAIGGKALRREVDVFFGQASDAHSMRLLIYTPKSKQPVAGF